MSEEEKPFEVDDSYFLEFENVVQAEAALHQITSIMTGYAQ